jgi:hypothetical protein
VPLMRGGSGGAMKTTTTTRTTTTRTGGGAPGWRSAVDPASGQTYYVNNKTGVTQWTRP